MLTRLQVDGFKNLRSLDVEFGPFTCIAGANGTGKSNVFDAIEFLSLLSSQSLMEAAQEVRSTSFDRSGDPKDLFWRGAYQEPRHMRFAAEMIIPRDIEDDFGRQAEATITFVRYEVEIGYEPASGLERVGRLVLERESLERIKLGDAAQRLGFRHAAGKFRKSAITGRRAKAPFISTEVRGNDRVITIHQDGGSRGRPIMASPARAPATVVKTVTDADLPTILAARREMQAWRRIALEPSALREPDRYDALLRVANGRDLTVNGRHLPAALYRIATRREKANETPDTSDTYARVAARLNSLVDVGVRRVLVEADDQEHRLTLKLEERNGIQLPARSLSDGTLRFLALSVLLEDADARGVYCMEEPENGMHPASLPAMVEILRDLAVEPMDSLDSDNPLRQVIANTHSPTLVQLLSPHELLYASTRVIRLGTSEAAGALHSTPGLASEPNASLEGGSETAKVLRLAPLTDTWRDGRLPEPPVTKADILPYLTVPVGAQITLNTGGA